VWFEHTRPKAVGDFLLLQNLIYLVNHFDIQP
jgi:hypothetical protein